MRVLIIFSRTARMYVRRAGSIWLQLKGLAWTQEGNGFLSAVCVPVRQLS